MKKILLVLTTCFICSCVSKKSTFTALNTGNYDQAISTSLSKLRANKNKKSKQEYILILEDAFIKASERDINAVNFLEKEGNPANLEQIYNSYNTLKNRQERIRPLLPLYHVEQGRNANFSFDNYDKKIIDTKEKLATYLYNNAKKSLTNARQKNEYRNVYNDLIYLEKINPNYKDSQKLIEEAHYKGTNFVKVTMKNRTNVVIPKRLESDLLNFNTYGLDDLWTVYHGNAQASVSYDYEMEVALREINISPERIKEKELQREKQVKDGWEYLLNDNDDFVLDEEGKKIKVDKIITVRCIYYEFKQYKETQVVGNVQYKNLRTRQLLDAFPLSSTYAFEHIYANYKGDKRALDDNLIGYLGVKSVPFPSNEQMVYDSGEDLKNRLKNIITGYRFK